MYNLTCRGDSLTLQKGQVTASAWRDNKVFIVMSTCCQPTEVGTALRRQRDGIRITLPCPDAIVSYNAYMGGVDRGDQLRGYYSCRSKSIEGNWSTAGHPPSPSSTWKETRPTLCRRSIDPVLRALRRNLVDHRTPTHSFDTSKETRPTLCRRSIASSTNRRTPTLPFEHFEGNSPNVVSTPMDLVLRALRMNLVDRRTPSPLSTWKETRPTLCRRPTDRVLRALRRNLVDQRTPSPLSTWKETRPTLCRRAIDPVLRALRRNLVDHRTPTH